jgi:hypothetical protein
LFSLRENKWRSWRRAARSKPKTKTRKNDNMLVNVWGLGVNVWGLGISLFPDSAGNKGRFAQPKIDNMLVVVWGLGINGAPGVAQSFARLLN